MDLSLKPISGRAFLAYPEMLDFLLLEITERFFIDVKNIKNSDSDYSEKEIRIFPDSSEPLLFGNLLYIPQWKEKKNPYWAATVLEAPALLDFSSIKQAALSLRNIQRNWASYQYKLFRRAALIVESLPYINPKPRSFPYLIPESPMGLFTLVKKELILCSAKTSSPLAAGCLSLVEDKIEPPSRAYLKFQEALTRLYSAKGSIPQKNERCLDLGACPGGWTWVLRQLGCEVLAVDRTALDEKLMKDPKVRFIKHDAFTLPLEELGPFDWIFSDVICYPERLLEWVKKILASGITKKMICTIKLQGDIDWQIIDAFAEIPHSFVQHLCYNKHELTWFYCE